MLPSEHGSCLKTCQLKPAAAGTQHTQALCVLHTLSCTPSPARCVQGWLRPSSSQPQDLSARTGTAAWCCQTAPWRQHLHHRPLGRRKASHQRRRYQGREPQEQHWSRQTRAAAAHWSRQRSRRRSSHSSKRRSRLHGKQLQTSTITSSELLISNTPAAGCMRQLAPQPCIPSCGAHCQHSAPLSTRAAPCGVCWLVLQAICRHSRPSVATLTVSRLHACMRACP